MNEVPSWIGGGRPAPPRRPPPPPPPLGRRPRTRGDPLVGGGRPRGLGAVRGRAGRARQARRRAAGAAALAPAWAFAAGGALVVQQELAELVDGVLLADLEGGLVVQGEGREDGADAFGDVRRARRHAEEIDEDVDPAELPDLDGDLRPRREHLKRAEERQLQRDVVRVERREDGGGAVVQDGVLEEGALAQEELDQLRREHLERRLVVREDAQHQLRAAELADGAQVGLHLDKLLDGDEHALKDEGLTRREERDEAALQPERIRARPREQRRRAAAVEDARRRRRRVGRRRAELLEGGEALENRERLDEHLGGELGVRVGRVLLGQVPEEAHEHRRSAEL